MQMPVERGVERQRQGGAARARLNPQPNVQMERPQFHGAVNQVSLVAQRQWQWQRQRQVCLPTIGQLHARAVRRVVTLY